MRYAVGALLTAGLLAGCGDSGRTQPDVWDDLSLSSKEALCRYIDRPDASRTGMIRAIENDYDVTERDAEAAYVLLMEQAETHC